MRRYGHITAVLYDWFSGEHPFYRRGRLAAVDALGLKHGDRVLVLGCGTGLCGPLLKAFCTHVHGVDLSPTMVAQAAKRQAYDTLTEADIADHLLATPARHGLVVSTDVFIYVGDLALVFAGVRRVLNQGGVFAFSVEVAPGSGYVLQPSMRYAHSENYLRTLAAAHGFDVLGIAPTVLREDQQRPIAGLVATMRAP